MKDADIKIKLLNNTVLYSEADDGIPFPQANSFDMVIKTLCLLYSDINSARLISQCIGYADREGKYYIDALRYLRLVEKSKKDGNYYLTEEGFALCACGDNRRNVRLASKILEHKTFYRAFEYATKNNEMPTIATICDFMLEDGLNLSKDTLKRRAGTVKGWIQWLMKIDIDMEGNNDGRINY